MSLNTGTRTYLTNDELPADDVTRQCADSAHLNLVTAVFDTPDRGVQHVEIGASFGAASSIPNGGTQTTLQIVVAPGEGYYVERNGADVRCQVWEQPLLLEAPAA